jgi:hypothetical protein
MSGSPERTLIDRAMMPLPADTSGAGGLGTLPTEEYAGRGEPTGLAIPGQELALADAVAQSDPVETSAAQSDERAGAEGEEEPRHEARAARQTATLGGAALRPEMQLEGPLQIHEREGSTVEMSDPSEDARTVQPDANAKGDSDDGDLSYLQRRRIAMRKGLLSRQPIMMEMMEIDSRLMVCARLTDRMTMARTGAKKTMY